MSDHAAKEAPAEGSLPYRDFKSYLRQRFGATVFKLPIDAGFTCPNRDGTVGVGGCTYCDGRGSRLRQAGPLPTVAEQVRGGMAHYREKRGATAFMPYFQTFTNTHAPIDKLKRLYDEALAFPDMVGLSVGTRPDALPDDVIALLAGYQPAREVWVELGVQTLRDETLQRINRCHDAAASISAIHRAAAAGLKVCAHLILGLPGESVDDIRRTARELATLPIAGVKLHGLLVLDGTPLAAEYRQGKLTLPTMGQYASWVVDVLELLPAGVVVQRLTADGYRDILLAPDWPNRKLETHAAIVAEFHHRPSHQGSRACTALHIDTCRSGE
jgi:radical SAM protein (TIGR01212 family)